jgi:glutaminyl-tRNA synthetase
MLQLVQEGVVAGWDDPRMPTICGLRRRGYTPEAIRDFIDRIGYTKVDGMIDVSLLEHSIREDLKPKAHRVSALFDPIKLVITNYPEGQKEYMTTDNNPDNEAAGTREMPFGREIFIERGDFMEDAPKDFFRLTPGGREVRLKSAYIIQCTGCEKDENGQVTTVYCTYDPDTKSGTEGSKRKVKSTINWLDKDGCIEAEVRLYDRLFKVEDPAAYDGDFHDLLNEDSLEVKTALVEKHLEGAQPGDHFQFLKIGYFTVDKDSQDGKLILNRTVSLKDNWAKK